MTVVEHPLVQEALSRLRDARTEPIEFRRSLGQASLLLGYEATREFETRAARVRTPLAAARSLRLRRPILLVPILRAGLGLLPGLLQLLPQARVGLIGVRRHHRTLCATVYHKSLPADAGSSEILLIDPMLATGGSAIAALGLLRRRGAKRMRLVSLVAAPEGIARVQRRFADVSIITAAIDERLNDRGYIVPGLGDAGERLFGI
ncbi:MAG TPA: uracil phosphoribosyltransferase [Verrucomicrobiae bacterium]|nr:uracil phosphoribosyltransferase [Verrucomicrobiae bacterium]